MLYRKIVLSVSLLVLLLISTPAIAQGSFAAQNPEDLEVWLMIVGPGPAIYSWWGHIGLVVVDSKTGKEYLYDYGNFSFEAENFIANFAMGRLWFEMLRVPFALYVPYTTGQDRSIRLHRLNLPADRKAELLVKLETNFRPENRVYLYHHYRDNCSTRIRDLIDAAIDGQWRQQTGAPSAYTLREMSRHFADHSSAGYWLINFLLAGSNDRPVNLWDEMFVPSYLERLAMETTYKDANGQLVKLVDSSQELHRSSSYGEGGSARPVRYNLTITLFLLVLLSPGLLLFAFKAWRLLDLYRILLYVALAVPGSVLFFMMTFSDHDVTWGNWNILLASPLLLFIIPLTILKYRTTATKGRIDWELVAGMGFSALLLSLTVLGWLGGRIPAWYQDNTSVCANFFGLYLAFFVMDWRRRVAIKQKPSRVQ